ncbi:iron-sulfur cluster insertion protein ErpA [Natronosporangium hydrolyticum]|uniref:Iron-sulfur cluster insertion protein ErpA n=1 Tax=Natronosporangium hydrolyticum TaxID=2811111 RepID=A0A895YBB9_9ACTN|nr:iron-sulfur cluster insertion protein ErpA [Natronosporangium hydrolyticum]
MIGAARWGSGSGISPSSASVGAGRILTGVPGSSNVTTPTETQAEPQESRNVVLTDIAASKVKTLLEQEGRDDLRLRIAVQPGGCSGLRYQLFFDERSLDGDIVNDFDGVEVVVDRMSAPYLTGATIDFADKIDAQGFTIDNPNAQGSCACGDSFH